MSDEIVEAGGCFNFSKEIQDKFNLVVVHNASDLKSGDVLCIFNYEVRTTGFNSKQAQSKAIQATNDNGYFTVFELPFDKGILRTSAGLSSHPDYAPHVPSAHTSANLECFELDEGTIQRLVKDNQSGPFLVRREDKT